MAKDFKPPARASTLAKQAKAADVQLPPVLKVSTLVMVMTGSGVPIAGWIIQNSLCPGGQTGSYLVLFAQGAPDVYDTEALEHPQFGHVVYPQPFRVDHSKIVGILDPELP